MNISGVLLFLYLCYYKSTSLPTKSIKQSYQITNHLKCWSLQQVHNKTLKHDSEILLIPTFKKWPDQVQILIGFKLHNNLICKSFKIPKILHFNQQFCSFLAQAIFTIDRYRPLSSSIFPPLFIGSHGLILCPIEMHWDIWKLVVLWRISCIILGDL